MRAERERERGRERGTDGIELDIRMGSKENYDSRECEIREKKRQCKDKEVNERLKEIVDSRTF